MKRQYNINQLINLDKHQLRRVLTTVRDDELVEVRKVIAETTLKTQKAQRGTAVLRRFQSIVEQEVTRRAAAAAAELRGLGVPE